MKKEYFVTNELYIVYKNGQMYCEGFYAGTDADGVCTFHDANGVNCKHHVGINDYSFAMFV